MDWDDVWEILRTRDFWLTFLINCIPVAVALIAAHLIAH